MNDIIVPEVSLRNLDTGEKVIIPAKVATVRYKPRYICKTKVKRFALHVSKSQLGPTRSKMFRRVGTSFYEACDAFLANFIASRVRSHPSKGKTLT